MKADITRPESERNGQRTGKVTALLVAVTISATFFVDLYTPAGVALGVFPYFIAIALTAWIPWRPAPVTAMAVCSILVLTGLIFAKGDLSPILIFNRVTIILLLSFVTLMVVLRRKSKDQLQHSHDTLEQEVARRTSELVLRNQQLASSNQALHHAMSRSEAANTAKTRFLSQMSHELRTPLNAILGFSDAMRMELLGPLGNPGYRQYSSDIYDSGSYLFKMLGDMLEASQLESGEYTLMEKEIDVPSLVADIIQEEAHQAAVRQLSVKANLPAELPWLYADPVAVRRMLASLLSNAVKFSPHKAVVTVTAGVCNGGVRFEIHDHGKGIAPEDLELVLQPFETGLDAEMAGKGGAGLGLSITRALAVLHNATLELERGDPQGTIAILQFPPERSRETQPAGISRS